MVQYIQDSDNMVCNGCGRIISDDATKCDFCYTEVEKIDVEKYKKGFMPKRNPKELFITFILIIVLVIVGFILYNNIKDYASGENSEFSKSNNTTIDEINRVKDAVDNYNKN